MFKMKVMMEKILSQVCYHPSSPASYGGKEAVYKAAKALCPKITQRKWQHGLANNSTTLCINQYVTTLKPIEYLQKA